MGTDEATSLAACIAHVLETPVSVVPRTDGVELRQWLAQQNLGLVPVASPAAFQWPGAFLARTRGRWVVLFGVPPGVVFDPSGGGVTGGWEAVYVLSPHDLRLRQGSTPPEDLTDEGVVELIALSNRAGGAMRVVESARALRDRGLEGDRYAEDRGTFRKLGRGGDMTLVEAESLEALRESGVELAPEDARRNLVVRGIALDRLIGRRFRVGAVECYGQRRCEPCAHLEALAGPGVLRGLAHRGGLRADILSEGRVRTGAAVAPC